MRLGRQYDGEEVTYQVGDLAEGGIVFYVDSTGQHGLVAAMEDIEGTYEWGCYGTDINGNNSNVSPELDAIGTGLQNTLEIVAECSETPIAASEALAYESQGYSDWYLPSYYELLEMYTTIGSGGLNGNIGGFDCGGYCFYWSSSESNNNRVWIINFGDGNTEGDGNTNKDNQREVRVIRSF